jgi:hypothetical protein
MTEAPPTEKRISSKFTTEGNKHNKIRLSCQSHTARLQEERERVHTPRSFAIKTLNARPWTSVIIINCYHSPLPYACTASSANAHVTSCQCPRNWKTLPKCFVPIWARRLCRFIFSFLFFLFIPWLGYNKKCHFDLWRSKRRRQILSETITQPSP